MFDQLLENRLFPFIEKKVMPFIKAHEIFLKTLGRFLGGVIYYGWIPAMCIAALILGLNYRATLLEFWRYAVPTNKPPLAIDIPVANVPCTRA
jgi:hypothetical protein